MRNKNIFKFEVGDIYLWNSSFNELYIFYYINETSIERVYQIFDRPILSYHHYNNPINFNTEQILPFIKLNNLKLNEMLKSKDTTIIKMAVTVLNNEYGVKYE